MKKKYFLNWNYLRCFNCCVLSLSVFATAYFSCRSECQRDDEFFGG